MSRLDLELAGLVDEMRTWTDDAVELLVVAVRHQVVKKFGFEEEESCFFDDPESATSWAAGVDDWYLNHQDTPGSFERARGAAALAYSFDPDARRALPEVLYEAIHSGIENAVMESLCRHLRSYQRKGRRAVRTVGLWFTQADMTLPDPWWFIVDRHAEVPTGAAGWHYMGFSYCRLCGIRNGNAEFTDGSISWPEGLNHYVNDHGVRLPVIPGDGDPFIGDLEGVIADLFEHDTKWWRETTKPLVAFAESVALWSARQAGIDDVVSCASELLDHEMAGHATAVVSGATRIEMNADMSEMVERACRELGIRFDQPESQLAHESANRVRFLRCLRQPLSGWELLSELTFVVDTTASHHDDLRTLQIELETGLFVEDEGGTPVGRVAERTQVETELKALAYRNLAVTPLKK